MTAYKDNGDGNWVDAVPICELVSMIMEAAAALLVDDMNKYFEQNKRGGIKPVIKHGDNLC